MLTTQREKVKVLLVLYDGGVHAQQASQLFPKLFFHIKNPVKEEREREEEEGETQPSVEHASLHDHVARSPCCTSLLVRCRLEGEWKNC